MEDYMNFNGPTDCTASILLGLLGALRWGPDLPRIVESGREAASML
jgi:hypothetical protein